MIKTIPDEWVHKLFACMSEFYGDRWDRLFTGGSRLQLAQAIWKSGLVGLTYMQIKQELLNQKKRAARFKFHPPTVMEFFHLAKRHSE